jgi:G3E family GTPase
MAALSQAVIDQPDAVVVEASGLSDPTGIYRLLSETEAFARAFRYRGSICLVDAARLLKVFHTVRVCPRQLAVSSLILVNKMDIATPEQREEVLALLREQCPGAHIIETQYGAITAGQLELLAPLPAEGDITHRPDITLQKAAIRISPLMTLQELRYFIAHFAEDTYRVKGILQLQEGVFLIDCVGPVLQISPCDYTPDDNNTLTALSGPRMPLRKSLIEAIKWYPGKAEWTQ